MSRRAGDPPMREAFSDGLPSFFWTKTFGDLSPEDIEALPPPLHPPIEYNSFSLEKDDFRVNAKLFYSLVALDSKSIL